MAEIPQSERPLSPEERARFNELAEKFTNKIPFCPVQPNPGPQTMFLLDFSSESLYGGAAGGGKSWAMLMSASQFLDVPGYNALILRKSYQDLIKPEALIDVASQWWGGMAGANWKASEKTWEFSCPGGGMSRIVFGSLDEEQDRFKYQGGAYQFIGFDELTQFKERDYRYLFSRRRRKVDGPIGRIPMRVRSTTNPGGVGHEWVYKRFILPWEKWQQGRAKRPVRNFHPADISDNPKLDQEDYERSLMELDPVTRAQLMKGDWSVRISGRMFKRDWFKPCDINEVPRNCLWVRFWDMASTDKDPGKDPDFTAGALVGRAPSGAYYIVDMRRWRHEAAENDLMLRATAFYDTVNVAIGMEQEGGSSGKIAIHHYRSQVLPGFTFRGVPAVTKGTKTKAAGPVASQAQAGMVYMVRGTWNEKFLDEAESFPDVTHDDQVDAVSGAFAMLARMFHLGINMGVSNQEFATEDSGWRPDTVPDFDYMDIATGQTGVRDLRPGEKPKNEELSPKTLEQRVRSAWAV